MDYIEFPLVEILPIERPLDKLIGKTIRSINWGSLELLFAFTDGIKYRMYQYKLVSDNEESCYGDLRAVLGVPLTSVSMTVVSFANFTDTTFRFFSTETYGGVHWVMKSCTPRGAIMFEEVL